MKDSSITQVVERLREQFGPQAIQVCDNWQADLCAVGIVSTNSCDRLVYISTFDKSPGRYDVSLELPPAAGSDLPYSPGGDWRNIDFDTLAVLIRTHLMLA